MGKRPPVLVCLALVAILLAARLIGFPVFGKPLLPRELQSSLADGCRLSVEGEIADRQAGGETVRYLLKNCSFTFRDEEFRIKYIRVSEDAGKERLPAGSVARFSGTLREIAHARNPGQFDAADYYATLGVYHSLFADRCEVLREGGGISETMLSLRERMVGALHSLLGEESAGVLAAMAFGERRLLTEDSRADYRAAGIFHIVCISGLHISMLGMALFRLLFSVVLLLAFPGKHLSRGRLRAAQGLAALLAVAGMGLYCVFVGSPPSALRALVMFAVMLGARLCGRSYDSMSALALAGILLLLSRPGLLFHSGFQLSFVAVLGAGGLYPLFLKRFRESEQLHAESRRAHRLRQAREGFVKGVLLWLCATSVTLPLVAAYYGEIPVWGLLANLLLVPLVGIVLASGLLGAALSLFAPVLLSRIALLPAELLLRIFALFAGGVRRLPLALWVCGMPAPWQVVFYCAGLFFAVMILLTGRRRAGAILLAALTLAVFFWRPQPAFSLAMLDVGQGDCFVIRRGARTFLMDGGSSDVSEVGRYRILPYLKHEGIRRVDGIFISHGDDDHISGIEELLDEAASGRSGLSVGAVFFPAWMREDEIGMRMAGEAEAAGAEVAWLHAGDVLRSGELCFRVLAPEGERASEAEGDGRDSPGKSGHGGMPTGNEGSLVLHLRYREFDALLTGDLEEAAEERLIPRLPDVELLKVAHHGSRNSTSAEFLEACRPELCFVSAPDGGRYGHPHQETLDRIADFGAACFITRDCGAVTVSLKAGQVRIETYY